MIHCDDNKNDTSNASKSNKEKDGHTPFFARGRRHLARLRAVQALYQMTIYGQSAYVFCKDLSIDTVNVQDSQSSFFIRNKKKMDVEHFLSIVIGVDKNQYIIDQCISQCLKKGWRMSRIDSVFKNILRAGLFEILYKEDIPKAVTINEYMDIMHSFFCDEALIKMAHGILDAPHKLPQNTATKNVLHTLKL